MNDSTRRRLRRTSACPAPTHHLNHVKGDEREMKRRLVLRGMSATLHNYHHACIWAARQTMCCKPLPDCTQTNQRVWEQCGQKISNNIPHSQLAKACELLLLLLLLLLQHVVQAAANKVLLLLRLDTKKKKKKKKKQGSWGKLACCNSLWTTWGVWQSKLSTL